MYLHCYFFPQHSSNHLSIFVFSKLLNEKDHNFSAPLIFQSPKMKQIMSIIQNVSQVDSTVLLLGESGVGKSAIAKLIHDKSKRRKGPFVSVNCGALPESLIESELFGYEAGTFTGGHTKGKKGLFESAENGTILLDEIAELPFFMQSKLLDVVQENMIRKVGGIKKKKVNVRILAATNKNLAELVKEGKFREDLYYRLNVVPIVIPPLRERKEDIPELIEHFLKMFHSRYGRSVNISEEVKQKLIQYDWPGNIRELANKIERLVITNQVTELGIELSDRVSEKKPLSWRTFTMNDDQTFPTLKEAKSALEKELILKAYKKYENTYKTAEALGVDQSTISKKLKLYRNEQ